MSQVQSCFQRYEKKYLLTPAQYRTVRQGMAPYMKPDAHPKYSISNIYYDTENFELIRASLEKPVYKEKLRLRSYGVPGSGDDVFVELKKKFDGVVYKRRIPMQMQEAARYLQGAHKQNNCQIGREIDWFFRFYQPTAKAFIAYDREAWAAADGGELRITFDTALRVRSDELDLRYGDHGVPLLNEDMILMEVKIPGAAPSWLARLFSENGIFPTTFSKYGTYYKEFICGGRSAVTQKEGLLSA